MSRNCLISRPIKTLIQCLLHIYQIKMNIFRIEQSEELQTRLALTSSWALQTDGAETLLLGRTSLFEQVLCLGRGRASLTPSALAVCRLHLDWTVHLETEEEVGIRPR